MPVLARSAEPRRRQCSGHLASGPRGVQRKQRHARACRPQRRRRRQRQFDRRSLYPQASRAGATTLPTTTKPCAAGRSLSDLIKRDEQDIRLDWTRAEGPEVRDVRHEGPPCHGEHKIHEKCCRMRNQSAMTLKCQTCQMRRLYVPVVGQTGEHRKSTPLKFTGGPSSSTTPRAAPSPLTTAKAKSASRHVKEQVKYEATGTGMSWRSFVDRRINTQELDEDDEARPLPTTTMEGNTAPQWDGTPETWEEFQLAAHEYLMNREKIREAEEPPQWDGDPDSLQEYQEQMQIWNEARRDERQEDRMSGTTTPASSHHVP